MATAPTLGERPNEPAHAPLLADYRRQLETGRGLSPATIRNYLADLSPFVDYLDGIGVVLGNNASGLRSLVMRDGEDRVGGEYRRLVRDYVSWLVEDRPQTLGLMHMLVHRNAFGRQVDSFETDLEVEGMTEGPFHAVFIRAPTVCETGPDVQVLSRLGDGAIVAVRQDHLLATAFHPELTQDLRFHRYFAEMVEASVGV